MPRELVDSQRYSVLNRAHQNADGSCVLYWMSRDQRATHNWALIRAIELANHHNVPVVVAFVLSDDLRQEHRQRRHYHFMLHGLAETASELRKQGIGFVMQKGHIVSTVAKLAKTLNPVVVVADQSSLRSGQRWRSQLGQRLKVPFEVVEANAIVPPAVASTTQQVAARTMRPRLWRQLDRFLTDYPTVNPTLAWKDDVKIADALDDQSPDIIIKKLNLRRDATPVTIEPGSKAAQLALEQFIDDDLFNYTERNDVAHDIGSHLSPYLHFGQISAQHIAYQLQNSDVVKTASNQVEAFLDQLITWRELAINYCRHHNSYDKFSGAPDWARQSLIEHTGDEREHLYSYDELLKAKTYDELWNAAQMEMIKTGRMHNYMRMYWGKKILEWTESPQTAVDWAIALNDTYQLDGRDPNGYIGVLWAVAGLHDRAWFERPIFGKVRYMNYNGAKRKFDIQAYIDRVNSL